MSTIVQSLIRKSPGLSGGDACVRQTRIAVWVLVGWKRQGWTDDRILANFPGLTESDLYAAWTYFASHTSEIETALRANDEG